MNPETMEFFQWQWWAGAGIVLMIAELFVPGLFLLCLGIGCIGGSLTAYFTPEPWIQLLAFSIVSLIAFFTIRPVLMKRFWKDGGVKTNAGALIGQRGKVSHDFEAGLRIGRVRVGGDDWRAESTTDLALRVGDVVEVVRVDSNTLIVKPTDQP